MSKKDFCAASLMAFGQLNNSNNEFNPFSSQLNEHLVFSNEGKGIMNTNEVREEMAKKLNP
jgi:hypothetical protein